MKPYALIIVGALVASIPWLFAFIWALDQPPQLPRYDDGRPQW